MTKTLLDTPEYCMELYRNSLREIRGFDLDSRLNFPKWKKDTLILILERARPNIKRKHLRRKVLIDLKRISDKAWEEVKKVSEEAWEKFVHAIEDSPSLLRSEASRTLRKQRE